MKHIIFLFLACVAFASEQVIGQTRINPDISVIGDFRTFIHNNGFRSNETNKLNLELSEAEVDISGYINPYATAWATFAWNNEESAEIEEFYVTFLRGLHLGANLRVGKYLLEFGRLNPVHTHAYSFIHRPLPHEEFFGDEGLRDMTLRLSFLLPTGGIYTEISGAVLRGDLLKNDQPLVDVIEEGEEKNEPVNLGYIGRVTSSLALSENSELALGISGLTAIYESENSLRAWIAGSDLKYRWKPSRNTSLTVECEALINRREEGTGSKVVTYGTYGYLDYRFRQRYNLGAIVEYTQDTFDRNVETWRVSSFIGFAPVEETSVVRFLGNWTEPANGPSFWTVTIQLIFSLGPHQVHNF